MLLLADEILSRLAAELGVAPPRLTAAAEAALCAYRFPGNVRELENILERAMTLASGDVIDVGDIQLRPDPQEREGHASSDEAPLETQLEEIERDAIVKALEQTRYNKTAAAKLLGISFRALRYRVKKLGID
jgi:two-component system response regulator PilR (NtrC family)